MWRLAEWLVWGQSRMLAPLGAAPVGSRRCRVQKAGPLYACLSPHCPAPQAALGLAALSRGVLAIRARDPGAPYWVSITKMVEMLTASGKERAPEDEKRHRVSSHYWDYLLLGPLGLLHPNAH